MSHRSAPRRRPQPPRQQRSPARNGNSEANLQGFTTAQQWDPNLLRCDPGDRFAPRVRAHELAKAAKSPSQR